MKKGFSTSRILTLGIIVLVLLSALVARLWWVQISRGSYYTSRIKDRSQVTVRLPAVRGEIRDRNGLPLVENRTSVAVDFYLPDMVRAYRQKNGSVPLISYRASIYGMPRDKSEPDVPRIVEEVVRPDLEKLGIARDYNTRKMQIHYRTNTEVPYSYAEDLDFETLAKYMENSLSLPGVKVDVKPVRKYVYGAFASHILGYVGAPNDVDAEEAKKFNFYQPDVEGKAQIELTMNRFLKGTAGTRILQRNAKGVIEGEVGMVDPVSGANVYLTIDARIQYIAEQALRAVGRGAAVVVDPNNGDILAMASVPSFDPNTFIPSISAKDWAALDKAEADPLLNRAISAYAPGSTYKIPVALAGLRAGVGNNRYHCSGGVQYGDKYMRCWIADKNGSHGTLDLEGAIKNSCNAFFFQYANAAKIEPFVAMGNFLGLGRKTGIPLSGEAPGILPGPQWLAENKPLEKWSQGYTANVAIGQGFVLATPLQMAMVTATVANGGIDYEPRLVDKVVAQDGTVLLQEPAKIRASLIADAGLTPEQIEKVRHGMWEVVNEAGGTAGRARIKGIEVAGKTGTAQFFRDGQKDNHTWFICFAPYENPKYAVAVIVQGAKSGGGVAGPLAAKILQDTFDMEAGKKEIQLASLEPAKGSYQFIESVDFGREIPAVASAASDDETPTGDATDARLQQNSKPQKPPSIRPEPDAEGKAKNKPKAGLEKFFDNFKLPFLGGGKKKDKPEPEAKPRPARTPGGR